MLLGWVVEKASVEEPDDCVDRMLVAVTERQPDRHRAFRRLVDLQGYLAIAFAGPMCEARQTGDQLDGLVNGAVTAARADLAGDLRDDEIERLIGRAGDHARWIIEHPRVSPVIEAVSGALIDRKTLTGAEVEGLVRPLLPAYMDLVEGLPTMAIRVRR